MSYNYLEAARNAMLGEDFSRAIPNLKYLISDHRLKRNLQTREHYLEALSMLCNCFMIKQDYTSAAMNYREILELEPGDAGSRYSYGVALMHLQHYAEAADQFRFVSKSHPGNPDVWHNWAICLMHQGRFDGAEETLERLLRHVPEHEPGRILLGEARRLQGKYAEAMDALTRVINARTKDPLAFYYRGLTQYAQEEFEAADRDFNQALALRMETPTLRLYLGNCYGISGDTERSIAHFRRAVEMDPTYLDAWRNMMIIANKNGRPEVAKEAAGKVLELAPGNAEAAKILS
ncbi:MAG: tetratricopeptide repeat protein [Bacteroidota bacterium]